MKSIQKFFFPLLVISFSFYASSCFNETGKERKKEMNDEVIVKSENGTIVLRYEMYNGKLHGNCVWYNGQGKKVSEGTFKNGLPWNGTFLLWNRHFKHEGLEENPFQIKNYCRDWITPFEASFLSQKVNYENLKSTFKNGKEIDNDAPD